MRDILRSSCTCRSTIVSKYTIIHSKCMLRITTKVNSTTSTRINTISSSSIVSKYTTSHCNISTFYEYSTTISTSIVNKYTICYYKFTTHNTYSTTLIKSTIIVILIVNECTIINI